MTRFYGPAGSYLRTVAWAYIFFGNPVVALLAVKSELKPFDSLLVVLLMGLFSCVIAVFWSGLFYRPSSRLTDWIALLLLYGAVSAALQAGVPVRSIYRKGQLLVPALMLTVWGGAWSWQYVTLFRAESALRRFGIMGVGVLFVIGLPVACWSTLLLVTFSITVQETLYYLYLVWTLAVLAMIPGILMERRARRVREIELLRKAD